MPVHFVPGNHDTLESEFKTTRRVYEKDFGSLLYVEEHEGVIFIFVYTEPLARSFRRYVVMHFQFAKPHGTIV